MNAVQDSMSPQEALERLIDGNRRFSTASSSHTYLQEAQRTGLVEAQHPFATLFGCSDSRVPVELVFDQGFGDLFVIRNAGHIVGESVLGSMEFAVAQLGCPLIVVLGHSGCGAVTAAIKSWQGHERPTGHIGSIVRAIEPVIDSVDTTNVNDVMRAHVVDSVQRINDSSELIAQRVQSGKLWLVAAEYDLATGAFNELSRLAHTVTQPRSGTLSPGR
jgi:carbonic anhydrase